jgi:fibronectin-binding autotransporter adhesin
LTIGNNNAGATYSGALTGSGTLIKAGTGIETFSGNNTLSGGIVVNGGLLDLSGNNSGASGLTVVNNNAALQIRTANSFVGAASKVIVGNGGVITFGSLTANPASVGFGTVSPTLNRIDPVSTGSLSLQLDSSSIVPYSENLDFSASGPGGALNVSLGAMLTGTAGWGNAPVQYTGIITPNGNTYRLGGGTGRLILSNSATLAGANNVNIGGGGNFAQLFLTANYGYTGSTLINAGTTIVTNLRNGGLPSSLGASSSAASNLILNGGTLQYVGNGATTDRLFTLGSSTSLDASGSAPLSFTNTGAISFLNSGNRTLTLQGSNAGANTFATSITDAVQSAGTSGVLADGATSLTKNGNGTWVPERNE